MTRLAMLALACLALALASVVALESRPDKARERLSPTAEAMRLEPVAPHAGDLRQVQNWVDIILARPLFEPSRRPPPTAGGSGASGPGFPRLTGIIIMPQAREAIFAVPGKAQQIVVTAGSRLDGALIKSIEPGAVIVVDALGARLIRPSFDTGTADAGAALAVAAPTAPVLINLPPSPSGPHVSPFASISGLSGRPLGLAARPDSPPPDGGAVNAMPSLPALAAPGGSP